MKYVSTKNYDLFEDMFNSFANNWTTKSSAIPVVNVSEDEKAFKIEAELPGLSLDDVNVEVDKHILTIESKDKKDIEDTTNYIIKERSRLTFKRRFTLPENVSEDGIEGEFANGILTIGIPKKEIPAPKKISVTLK